MQSIISSLESHIAHDIVNWIMFRSMELRSFETTVITFILRDFAHRFSWCINQWHIIKSLFVVFFTSLAIREDTPLFLPTILGAQSVTSAAGFCIGLSTLCSTFLISSYKSAPPIVPFTGIEAAVPKSY